MAWPASPGGQQAAGHALLVHPWQACRACPPSRRLLAAAAVQGPAAAAKAAGELVRWRRQASANLTAFQDRLLHDVVQLTRSHRAAATTGGAAAAPLFASMYDTQLVSSCRAGPQGPAP